MSTYTTGELAKLGGVSVRTIQYYDQKGVLNPTTISDGGRRLYTDKELKTLRLILLLKSMGLSLATIRDLLSEENANEILTMLLAEQERHLKQTQQVTENQLRTVKQVQNSLSDLALVSQKDLGGIENMMASQPKMRRLHGTLLFWGLIIDVIEVLAIGIWIMTGNWVPTAIGLPIVIVIAGWLVRLYYREVRYICPNCHTIFQPKKADFFFSRHTAKTRKLTCTHCRYRGYCVEMIGQKSK
ncbi:MerR family transcriptional regulator [Lentilactobacillus kisonensis]|nr:MerR family transcriptional regulator [Lentilactobacillus kisonensis]EHO51527.1 transcriptional regulator, MerR family [Lentilactobacillus kisonensis F0435]